MNKKISLVSSINLAEVSYVYAAKIPAGWNINCVKLEDDYEQDFAKQLCGRSI